MYHLRLKGSHYEMGKKVGMMLKRNAVQLPIVLDSFQREFGVKSAGILQERFPRIYETCYKKSID